MTYWDVAKAILPEKVSADEIRVIMERLAKVEGKLTKVEGELTKVEGELTEVRGELKHEKERNARLNHGLYTAVFFLQEIPIIHREYPPDIFAGVY